MYPQGGGQASDQGTIYFDNQELNVTFVSFLDGEVLHFCDYSEIKTDLINKEVTLTISDSRRILNSKLHSAGHLISGIIEKIHSNLKAVKGFHFPDGPYVEFKGEKFEDNEKTIQEANNMIYNHIEKETPITTEFINYDDLKKRCSNIPTYIPKDKPLRIATILGFEPLPCGGTHIKSCKELLGLKISKIKNKKGNIKISYNLFN